VDFFLAANNKENTSVLRNGGYKTVTFFILTGNKKACIPATI
jgi:hypothetical protein